MQISAYSQLEVKALLCNHIEKVIDDEPQVIEKLRRFEANKTDIVSIQLGSSEQRYQKYLIKIAEANDQIEGFEKERKLGSERKYLKET